MPTLDDIQISEYNKIYWYLYVQIEQNHPTFKSLKITNSINLANSA